MLDGGSFFDGVGRQLTEASSRRRPRLTHCGRPKLRSWWPIIKEAGINAEWIDGHFRYWHEAAEFERPLSRRVLGAKRTRRQSIKMSDYPCLYLPTPSLSSTGLPCGVWT
jgi:hypothetical protein